MHNRSFNKGYSLSLIALFLFIITVNAQEKVTGKTEAQNNLQAGIINKVSMLVNKEYSSLVQLYKQLHSNPELSFHEKETSKHLAGELKKLGFDITENIGGYGVVGVLKNGEGPTIMVRTDMDALPLKEETGLSFSSKVTAIDSSGKTIPVMHACGHDLHMSVWVGTARVLAELKAEWKGTLVFIAQPAEEKGAGAKAMIADGLFTKFPRPDYGLALHVNASLEAGKIGYTPGYSLANTDVLRIQVKGKGGHGAAPHKAINPVVIASKIVLELQMLSSSKLSPITDPAVISVGSIHGGSKANIIPSEVILELTIRSFSDSTRQLLIEKIKNISNGIAMSADLNEADYPVVKVLDESTPSVYNNPELTERMSTVFKAIVGPENVVKLPKEMVSEDFSRYTRVKPSIPTLLYSIGTVPKIESDSGKAQNYFTHSSKYFPILDPSLKLGVESMCMGIINLLRAD